MGKIGEKFKNIQLKKAFRILVIFTVIAILIASALSVCLCVYFQKKLLPESQQVYLVVERTFEDGKTSEIKQRIFYGTQTELAELVNVNSDKQEEQNVSYTVEQIENNFSSLTPKRKALYCVLNVLIFLMPILYSVIGVSFCSYFFYRKKLEQPILLLADAAKNIMDHNLDFEVMYHSDDEMGQLCKAFEQMRTALYKNNQELWKMVEEQKKLQASVAHDLRNPIAIIKGYAEYMQQCTENGKLNIDKVGNISNNLVVTANRMEKYTESIKYLNNLEELQIHKEVCDIGELLNDIAEDFKILAEKKGLLFEYNRNELEKKGMLDRQVLYRILENIFMNALRFAQHEIKMQSLFNEGIIKIVITDDGIGFSNDVLYDLQHKLKLNLEGEHMGMGLAISKILCRKHGGNYIVENLNHGAKVTITLLVQN